MILRAALVLSVLPGLAGAVSLHFPANATEEVVEVTPMDSYSIPVGPWKDGAIPTVVAEGAVSRSAWRIGAAGLTTLQILAPLRDQLTAAGFEILFECQTDDCGGFDFRFGTEVLPPPRMEVDLGDFRFLSTRNGAEVVSLMVSRTAQAGFVQVIRVGPPEEAAPVVTEAPVMTAPSDQPPTDFATQLDQAGHVVLTDLTFETGSAQLAPGPYPSLVSLAEYLKANPTRTVALVGHTDASGSLDGNIALSKRRAGSVLERLVSVYGIPRSQLDAEGMGYLAPVASNLTEAGREANRRVEVIVTSTE